MLKHLRKLFPAEAGQPASAETVKEEVDMSVQETGAEKAPVDTNAADMAGVLASVTALAGQLEEANSKIATLKAALSAVDDAKAVAEASAQEAKMAARKTKIVAAVGTDKADALMSALSTMSDPAFDAVMVAMSTTTTAEASSMLFTEVGIDAQADVKQVLAAETSNPTMDYLKSKYPK